MAEGLSPDLLLAASATFGACALLLSDRVGLRAGLLLAFVKVALVAVYFAWIDTGAWRLLDDVTYAEEAARLASQGVGPLALFLDPVQGGLLEEVAGGRNVGYYVVNLSAQIVFGDHYWAAVFVNVALTCVAMRGLDRILRLARLPVLQRRALDVFFLLHWDVLAWSSFFNLKDTLVMTLGVWLFAWALTVARRPRPVALVALFLVGVGMWFVRWYAVGLFALAFGMWGVIALSGWKRMVLLVAGLVAAPVFLGLLQVDLLRPRAVLEGAVGFALTPRPWGVRESYSFLLLPATLHWLCAPVALWGAVSLWRRVPLARPLLVYAVVLVGFYAMVPHLAGPRHRFQGVFVLAWVQFEGLRSLLVQVFGRRSARVGGLATQVRGA